MKRRLMESMRYLDDLVYRRKELPTRNMTETERESYREILKEEFTSDETIDWKRRAERAEDQLKQIEEYLRGALKGRA